MKEEEARSLLKRYRLGQCTENEARIIESWLQSLGKESSDQLDLYPSIGAGDKMLDEIEQKIDLIEENNSNFVKSAIITQTKPGYFEWILKIAAILRY
ncbi:MAG: hypothetical protein WD398_10320 [Cyclobacteriaceae bacterium]